MKLYFAGHNYKYAAEQMLLTLFPGQRPEYPTDRRDRGRTPWCSPFTWGAPGPPPRRR